ncbi:hypothetical protein [Pseudonocardia terrae]|nr:hypothetical protein [Pseudonocardia terrae]
MRRMAKPVYVDLRCIYGPQGRRNIDISKPGVLDVAGVANGELHS